MSVSHLFLLVIAMFAVAAMALPSPVFAHAEMTGTEPANEGTIEEYPTEIKINFSENVNVAYGGVKIYGPDGERVDKGDATSDGKVVTMGMVADEAGTYAVSWRAISADTHPVRGAFVFNVLRSSKDTLSREQALSASEGSRTKDIAFGISRALLLLSVLIASGAVIFSVIVDPSWRPRWLNAWLVLGVAGLIGTYLFDISIASGLSLMDTLDPAVLKEQASSTYGRATIVRLGIIFVCLFIAAPLSKMGVPSRRALRYLALVPFVALVASLSLSGHSVGEGMPFLRQPLDMIHAIAAAAWFGGLIQLIRYVRDEDAVDPAAVQRYSRLALGSVIVLIATGLYASWVEIGLSLDGLIDTTYGRLVVAKVALLMAALPLANANRVRNVPKIGDPSSGAAKRMRTYVRGEIILVVIVIAATAWLIQSVPAKVALRPGFIEQVIELPEGRSMQFIADPAAVGPNELHL
ncbi:MAG: CopD family protein, partial [Gaiellales bacterium]